MPPIRKQKSGYVKCLEKKKVEQVTQSQSGIMDNYVIKILHVFSSNNKDVGGDNNDEYVDMNVDEDGVKIIDVKNEDVGDVKLNDDDGVPIKETNIDYDHVEDVDADINTKFVIFVVNYLEKGIVKGQLDKEGFSDWKHLSTRLKENEVGLEHVTNMVNWFEMRQRVKNNETIDKVAQKQFEKDKDHLINVIFRIISVVKFLAKHNLAFRGTNEKLY
ncbi:zinc finger MYM-type protein 1 [Tanacetum coccineum]